MIKTVLKYWDFFAAISLAALGSYYLPSDAVKGITTELIAFFSIQSAVILPAMIFTAGILRPEGLELSDARDYHKALKAQMMFWVALLCLDFVAVASMIGGKGVGWSISFKAPYIGTAIDISWLFPLILYFAGSLAIFRTIPFVKGVLSLLDLNSEMTNKAIERRNRAQIENERRTADKSPISLPEGYGNITKPPG